MRGVTLQKWEAVKIIQPPAYFFFLARFFATFGIGGALHTRFSASLNGINGSSCSFRSTNFFEGLFMKEKKKANIGMVTVKTARGVPQHIAASMGRTIFRYAYLEGLLLKIYCDLMEISIKQGRIAVKLPSAKQCAPNIRLLLKFHKINLDSISFSSLGKKIERAEIARNTLAHSMVLDTGPAYLLQVVRGSWDLGQEYEPVSRVLVPEGVPLKREFLQKQRRFVEEAIKAVHILHHKASVALRTLHEKRRKGGALDRRLHPQTDSKCRIQPQA